MCPASGQIIALCSLSERPHYRRSSLPAFFQGRSCPRLPGRRRCARTGSRPVDPHPTGPGSHLVPARRWPLARPFQLGQPGLSGEAGAWGSSADTCCQLCPKHVERTKTPGHSQTSLLPASPRPLGPAPRPVARLASWPVSGRPSHHCHPLIPGRNGIVNK